MAADAPVVLPVAALGVAEPAPPVEPVEALELEPLVPAA
ncbi:MAG: hypothetical protein JWP65_2877, partial [Ramlibacter sp.]|nr:hypothetical protein [Ramlibacter sp.]